MKAKLFILLIVFSIVIAIFSGYSHYKKFPKGDLFYTPIDNCPDYSHSFTSAYLLTLLILGILWCVVSVLRYFIEKMRNNKNTRQNSPFKLKNTMLGIITLILIGMTYPIFEFLLPLQADLNCLKP